MSDADLRLGRWQDALADVASVGTIITDPPYGERTHAGALQGGEMADGRSLNLTDVTAMKIDVEGAEQEMLTGALSTLRRCRPILSIEIEERHRAGSTQAVPALLRHLDYVGFFEFYGDWRPIETLEIETMQKASPSPAAFEVSDPYVFCFYFVPPERIADLAVLARLP